MTNPVRVLPADVRLTTVKDEAKTFCKAIRSQDSDALKRFEVYFDDHDTIKLSQAQTVLAREYGFPSWAKLKSHVELQEELRDGRASLRKEQWRLEALSYKLADSRPTYEDQTSECEEAQSGKKQVLLNCSFCGKTQHEVRKLIAGPNVYVCDECVALCNDIITEEASSGDRAPPVS